MKPRVDDYGKVTVSLGGVCVLACRHCYTMTDQFVHDRQRTVEEVVSSLGSLEDEFSAICVSGDTDPFLDEQLGIELIEALACRFPTHNLMFTTRLIPSEVSLQRLVSVARMLEQRSKLLVPAVSLVSMNVPNFSERSKRIPPAGARIELLRRFHESGIPTLLALRPTFPLSLVPAQEVEQIIECASPYATAVLGEVFILDEAGQLNRRLGLYTSSPDRAGPMTFMQQPTIWTKRSFEDAVVYAADTCARHSTPYFLRSGTALRLLERYWDHRTGRLQGALLAAEFAYEPDP